MRQLAGTTSLNHVIGANTLYHAEYIRHYTGISPLLLPVILIDAVGDLSWNQTRDEFLLNSHGNPAPGKQGIVLHSPVSGGYELKDLTHYAGVVVFPYSITNGKVVEQYAMNIQMFVPTAEFAQSMVNDRTATYAP